MGNLNAKGNEKPLEQIYLSPTSKKNSPQEPNLPHFATAVSRMLNDPRSPTEEYARTPIYRADIVAAVASHSEDVPLESSSALEPAFAAKTIGFDEKYNEDFESEHTVSNDICIQNESGYESTKNRNASSSKTASQASYESQRTARHASSTQQKHLLATQSLKVLEQSVYGADDSAANTPSLSQHSARTVGLLTSFRSPGSASKRYQRINNE